MSAQKRRVRRAKRIPNGRRSPVTRAEFDRVIEILSEHSEILRDLHRNLDIQFKRIAQIQAELDSVRRVCDALLRTPK
jgi:hypothetical protein